MSSIDRAEQLKRELTDRWVLVRDGVPELRRFAGLTGKVKTVNMNCRALVEFDGAVDISWYDIDPSYLQVVDAPLPKKVVVEEKKAAAPAAAKPAAAASSGKSPLELAREQAAAQKAAPQPAGEKKLSPLEQARLQGAAGAAPAAPATKPATVEEPVAETPPPAPAPKPAPPADGKKLSPLEIARQQGAAKRD